VNKLRIIRYALWAVVLLAGGLLAWSSIQWQEARTSGTTVAALGGPFKLISDKGEVVTDETINATPHLLFFGFTHCPDVCPTTLFEAAGWLKALGDDANKLTVYFVTVDPERDTKEIMSDYVSAFDPRIRGLTGSKEQIEPMLKSYAVYHKKVPDADDPENYSMDHTASVFLMKKGGEFFGTIAYGEDGDTAIAKIKRLLKK
jgi:protein SCO1/2